MTYPVEYKGVTIMVESLDEAVNLTRKLIGKEHKSVLSSDSLRTKREQKTLDKQDTDESPTENLTIQIVEFWNDIDTRERLILTALAKQTVGIDTDELAAVAKVNAMDLKYCTIRISSRAKKHGINPKLLLNRKTLAKTRPVKSIYRMKDKARQAILPLIVGMAQQ